MSSAQNPWDKIEALAGMGAELNERVRAGRDRKFAILGADRAVVFLKFQKIIKRAESLKSSFGEGLPITCTVAGSC